MMTGLAGTGALVRLALRRDRVRLPVWILALAVVTIGTAAALSKLFPTTESRALFTSDIFRNPALLALVGPMFDPSTIGGLTAWRLGGLVSSLFGLASLLTVVRHTRAEEEAGRLELLGSAAIGRHAALAAALVVAGGSGLTLAALVGAGLVAVGLPPAGAIALGLGFAAAGWVFAAVAAVTAQLVVAARTASALAGTVLGLAFLLRAVGDATPGLSVLGDLSPIGWSQRLRPFAGERWAILGLAAALAAVSCAAAFALSSRRDLGAGLVAPRSGPATATGWLRGPVGLAWHLQRGAMLGWAAAFAVIGASLGGIAGSVADLLRKNLRLYLVVSALGGGAGGITDAFFAAIAGILGFVAAAYAVQATLRLRAEEEAGRAEPILASAVGRLRWAASHLVFAALGPALVLAMAGLAAGLVHGLRTGDVAGQLPRVLAAMAVQLPAVWVIAALALALYGLARRLAPASWAVLGACLVLGQLGGLLGLGPWAMALSPFSHVPRIPAAAFAPAPLCGLLAVALALTAAGLAGLRRRDLG